MKSDVLGEMNWNEGMIMGYNGTMGWYFMKQIHHNMNPAELQTPPFLRLGSGTTAVCLYNPAVNFISRPLM